MRIADAKIFHLDLSVLPSNCQITATSFLFVLFTEHYKDHQMIAVSFDFSIGAQFIRPQKMGLMGLKHG